MDTLADTYFQTGHFLGTLGTTIFPLDFFGGRCMEAGHRGDGGSEGDKGGTD